MHLLFVHDDREYLLEPGETLETDLGVLEVPPDVAPGDTVETHLGTPFRARQLRGPDLFTHLERTGAPMIPRDIGLVVGYTGVTRGDRVLDAGTGSGVLAAYLGRMGVDVLSFERDPDFAQVAQENMSRAGVSDQVEIRAQDVREALPELRNFDVITLDTADAEEIVSSCPAHLVSGGFLAVYSPFVEQARAAALAAENEGMAAVETVETIQREMDFDERGSRPATAPVGHTGYLTFARQM